MTDRKSFWPHLQEQFARTWAAHYQWSSISSSFLQALAVSKRVHFFPQDVTSSSSSCLSNTSPAPRPRYLLLLALPAGLVLVSALQRNGWSTFDWALEGMGCYLTQGAGFCQCHAFTLTNFRVCLLWQLESLITEWDSLTLGKNNVKELVPSNLRVKLVFARLVK